MSDPMITISLVTIISLGVNVLTIYRWVADHLNKEAQNDQAFHMLLGLANSVAKRVSMIVKRTNIMNAKNTESEEMMILLENMWADQMSTIDNLLAAAKALKPKSAHELPHDAGELLSIRAARTRDTIQTPNAT